jgi:hypothetical protein
MDFSMSTEVFASISSASESARLSWLKSLRFWSAAGLPLTSSWANATVGQTCVFENTPYTGYTESGSAYAFVVSRDK